MNDLYSKPCPCCGGSIFHNLADEKDDSWDTIYDEMVRQLLNDSETFTNKALYEKTAAALMQAIGKGLSDSNFNDDNSKQKLINAFKINIKAFSYAKNLTQFKYIKDHIFDDKGNLLDAAAVKKIVYDSGEVFNNRYLTVEHQFATQSAIMAHKWDTLNTEYLEFSTVGDNRVRPEHKIFDKFTAPKSDPIWKRLYTPLSWGCRCTIIPGVKSGLSKEYDSKWANKVVDPLVKGTIFDNNVGITHEIFTKNHPYFKELNDVIYNDPNFKEVKNKLIDRLVKGNVKVTRSELNNPITFTSKGIKESINQPHEFIADKNNMLLNIDNVLKKANYLGYLPDFKNNPMVKRIHVFETTINGIRTFLINREINTGEIHFYSTSDSEKVIKGIKK